MATVSFFCTRCRRLTTFPAARRGAIVYCPRCQQALIVPDIPATGGEGDEEKDGDGENGGLASSGRLNEAGQNEEDGANWGDGENRGDREVAARQVSATVASHLTPGKERPENWRRVETGEPSERNGAQRELDDASLLTQPEVSDAEFLRRLRPDASTQSVAKPPVAPPVLAASNNVETVAQERGISKLVWGATGLVALGSAFVVGAFWAGNARKNDVNRENQQVAKTGVFVEGALTYRTASGTVDPDDGAFVFFFPSEERFGAPIALGDVSPQRPNPPGFENVVADLEARGARFAVADFEGRFAFDDLEPGEYRVLLVSRRVGDDWGKANPAALKEIERCVVGPRLLLGQNRFFWTTRRFDRDAATLEKSFGKAGAPFSNVE